MKSIIKNTIGYIRELYCYCCEKKILCDEEYYKSEEETLCMDCYKYNTFECTECWGSFFNDEAYYSHDLKYCRHCYENLEYENDDDFADEELAEYIDSAINEAIRKIAG